MKSLATLCGVSAVLFSMLACNPTPTAAPDTHDADVKAITDVEVQANKDWAAKDADKIATFYADDAVLVTPGGDPLTGKDAINSAIKHMTGDPALSLTFHSSKVDVAKSGDLGYTTGPYQLTVTDPGTHKPVNDHGTYVTTFRKQADGSWKATVDIVTSAVPPMAPPKKK